MLALALLATVVGGFRLHRAAGIQRQQIRTQELQSAILEGDDAMVKSAFLNVAAHDPAEGARLQEATAAYLRGRTNFSTVEQLLDRELARQARVTRGLDHSIRFWLVLAAAAVALLIALLVLQFELARRSGRIDRDHARRAEELARLRDSLVAVVSHELRTPLTSVIGYLELLEEDTGNLREDQSAYLGVVRRGSDRLMSLVGELLLVLEADHGLLYVTWARWRCRTGSSTMRWQGATAADARSIVLRAEHGTSASIVGDQRRLAQLLTTSSRMRSSSRPTAASIVVRSDDVDDQLLLEVDDTGDGIAPEDRERLFDPSIGRAKRRSTPCPEPGSGSQSSRRSSKPIHGVIEVVGPPGGAPPRARIPATGTNPAVSSF